MISASLRDVLTDPSYREAAARISEVIAKETATDRAVEEIEMVAAAHVPS